VGSVKGVHRVADPFDDPGADDPKSTSVNGRTSSDPFIITSVVSRLLLLCCAGLPKVPNRHRASLSGLPGLEVLRGHLTPLRPATGLQRAFTGILPCLHGLEGSRFGPGTDTGFLLTGERPGVGIVQSKNFSHFLVDRR